MLLDPDRLRQHGIPCIWRRYFFVVYHKTLEIPLWWVSIFLAVIFSFVLNRLEWKLRDFKMIKDSWHWETCLTRLMFLLRNLFNQVLFFFTETPVSTGWSFYWDTCLTGLIFSLRNFNQVDLFIFNQVDLFAGHGNPDNTNVVRWKRRLLKVRGTGKLSGKPNKLRGNDLRWTSIPSRVGSISAALSGGARAPFPNSGWWSSLIQGE